MTSALAIFFRLAARAPRLVRLARPVFVRLAWLCAPAVRRGTAANAARLCPDADPRDFGLAVLGSFYDFVADVGRSRSVTPAALLARVARADGVDRYRAARRAGRGAVLVTAHMGSFEVGLAALSADERRVHVVFKRDAVPAFDVIRSELRDKLGVAEAAVDDGPAVWARLREALLRDEVVTVQGDRVLPGQRGQRVAVRGGHLVLPTGPFKLALSAGAPVVPIFAARRADGRVDLRLCDPYTVTDVSDAVLRYAAELSLELESHPTQWLNLRPAFVEDSAVAAAPACRAQPLSSPPSPP